MGNMETEGKIKMKIKDIQANTIRFNAEEMEILAGIILGYEYEFEMNDDELKLARKIFPNFKPEKTL